MRPDHEKCTAWYCYHGEADYCPHRTPRFPELQAQRDSIMNKRRELDAELIDIELKTVAAALRESHPEVREVRFAVEDRGGGLNPTELGTTDELIVFGDGSRMTGGEDDSQPFERIYSSFIDLLSEECRRLMFREGGKDPAESVWRVGAH